MSNIYKGVTPTLTFTFPNEVDLTEAESVWFTMTDDKGKLLFDKDQNSQGITVTSHAVEVYLTQNETLSMPPVVVMQVNWTYMQGGVLKRACSDKVRERFENNLKNEVIE